MKYALVEMDRKFHELEKKVKTPAASGTAAGRTTGRTTGGLAAKVGSSALSQSKTGTAVNTPRGSSRAGAGGVGTSSTMDARQRSRTPVANKMQNSLNTSMHS